MLCVACLFAAALGWAGFCTPDAHGQSSSAIAAAGPQARSDKATAGPANDLARRGQVRLNPAATPVQMSLNLRDANIRDALSSLALEFKVNLILSEAVQGTVTLHIFDATLEEAIADIATAGGYVAEETGNTIHVIKADPKAADDTADDPPVEMKIFRLDFADIDQIKETVNALQGLRPIQVHEATKTIFVEDTPANIKKVEAVINFLDAPPRQVLIEAKILEVKLTDDMAYGVDWSQIWGNVNIASSGFSRTALPDTWHSSPIPSTGSGGFANAFTKIGSDKVFSLAIDALKTKTTVNTVSTPKVMAVHGQPARVQVGGQQGYKVTTSNLGVVSETIEFINTGVILEITPFIDKHDNILLKVMPSINSATIEQNIPVVSSTSVSTTLVARSGQTIFIAGLIEDSQSKTQKQVPLLGDLPLIGMLFGSDSTGKEKTETIVMLTPQLMDFKAPAPVADTSSVQTPTR